MADCFDWVHFLKTGKLGQKLGYPLRHRLKAIPDILQRVVKISLYTFTLIHGHLNFSMGFVSYFIMLIFTHVLMTPTLMLIHHMYFMISFLM